MQGKDDEGDTPQLPGKRLANADDDGSGSDSDISDDGAARARARRGGGGGDGSCSDDKGGDGDGGGGGSGSAPRFAKDRGGSRVGTHSFFLLRGDCVAVERDLKHAVRFCGAVDGGAHRGDDALSDLCVPDDLVSARLVNGAQLLSHAAVFTAYMSKIAHRRSTRSARSLKGVDLKDGDDVMDFVRTACDFEKLSEPGRPLQRQMCRFVRKSVAIELVRHHAAKAAAAAAITAGGWAALEA
ncbi:hypothetical protein JKP88DRAFT_281106 [Tribonema minus]|uniref:Uncharacterized protein n=1 Tax=Tribonema minus TaxID=303371 RepID=A0A836C9V1_9STRA|nr:hypothetical protein JKP88DRAFT_281106 [Tribonema minus]